MQVVLIAVRQIPHLLPVNHLLMARMEGGTTVN